MEIKRITNPDCREFKEAFEICEDSFPLSERRKLPEQIKAFECPDYHFNILSEGGGVSGFITYWETDGFIYIEHLAIKRSLRGTGAGSAAVNSVKCGRKPLILEIEPPVDEITIRRRHFYERLGFTENPFSHYQLPYNREGGGCELKILTYPRKITDGEYEKFYDYFKNTVMKYSEK